jgi:hypothetical protein
LKRDISPYDRACAIPNENPGAIIPRCVVISRAVYAGGVDLNSGRPIVVNDVVIESVVCSVPEVTTTVSVSDKRSRSLRE